MPLALRSLVIVCLLQAAGCRLLETAGASRGLALPTAPVAPPVTLEVFAAPLPLGDPRLQALWTQADEQTLPAELRKHLAENGLQAALAGPSLPDALAEVLKLTDERISSETRSLIPMEPEPGIRLLVIQPRSGERRELVTSQGHEQMALLQRSDGQVGGKTLYKADTRLALYVEPAGDGRVRIELTPEVHHGNFKNGVSSQSDGVMMLKQQRQRKLFPELKIDTALAPGQMLLVTCQSDRPGSVGHYFFSQFDGEKPMQKLYVFRLSQSGPDRAFLEHAPADSEKLATDPAN